MTDRSDPLRGHQGDLSEEHTDLAHVHHVLGNTLDGGQTTPEEETRLAATFGALLRAERVRAGFNLRDFARALGISAPYLSRLERGQRRPRYQTIGVIAGLVADFTDSDIEDVRARLLEACGDSIRPDTERSRTAWARRNRKVWRTGARPLPPQLLERIMAAKAGTGPPLEIHFPHGVLRVGFGPERDGWGPPHLTYSTPARSR